MLKNIITIPKGKKITNILVYTTSSPHFKNIANTILIASEIKETIYPENFKCVTKTKSVKMQEKLVIVSIN